MNNAVNEALIIGLVSGVGIASEEIENVKTQAFALAKFHGLLAEIPEHQEPDEIDVIDVPSDTKTRPWIKYVSLGITACVMVVLFSHMAVAPAVAENPYRHERIVRTFDGKYWVVTVKRASPGYPYAEWLAQREITRDEVEAELNRIR